MHLGQPKVQDLELAVVIEADVARLQVAMNHVLAMRRFQTTHHLDAKLQHGLLRQRLFADLLVEASPGMYSVTR